MPTTRLGTARVSKRTRAARVSKRTRRPDRRPSRPVRVHDLDDGLDQRPRCEVLAGAALGILRVLFEQAFVSVALDVSFERRPLLSVDEIGDEAAQLRRILDLVLRLAEDDAEHSRLLAEVLQRLPVQHFQGIAVLREQRRPVISGGDERVLAPRRLGALVGHLQEEQEGELFDVVALGEAVVAEDVTIRPELLDDLGGGVAHKLINLFGEQRKQLLFAFWAWPLTEERIDAGGRGLRLSMPRGGERRPFEACGDL